MRKANPPAPTKSHLSATPPKVSLPVRARPALGPKEPPLHALGARRTPPARRHCLALGTRRVERAVVAPKQNSPSNPNPRLVSRTLCSQQHYRHAYHHNHKPKPCNHASTHCKQSKSRVPM